MIINQGKLFHTKPIKNMISHKAADRGVTYGLGEAGYDIRIKQDIVFTKQPGDFSRVIYRDNEKLIGRFCLASGIEEFQMPENLVGVVHDKSTWARRGLSVFNTVIEPGWQGFLTLELVYHGEDELVIPAGSGIAQVLFHEVAVPAQYSGRYQYQEDEPVPARSL